jgi:hypothetical protein
MTYATKLAAESAWLTRLGSVSAHDTYHLPGYQRLTTPAGYDSVLLSYESGPHRVVLPLTLRPLPDAVRQVTGFEHDGTSVYGYPGPLSSVSPAWIGGSGDSVDNSVDAAWRDEFAAWFTKVCAELSILTVFLRNNPLLDSSQLFTSEPFVLGAVSPTVAIDLSSPQDDRLAAATSHHRRALRKSLAHGLTFEQDHSSEAIAAFTECYLETMAKHDASESYLVDEARVTNILGTLGEHAELWVARKPSGEVPSAAIFFRTNGIIQYHLGGTRTEDYALGAARPLFEAVAESGHQRGDRWLHLGGGVGGEDDSLLRYKAGFGPDRFEFRTIRAVLDQAAYEDATRAVGLDPGRTFFPAYRTSAIGV